VLHLFNNKKLRVLFKYNRWVLHFKIKYSLAGDRQKTCPLPLIYHGSCFSYYIKSVNERKTSKSVLFVKAK